MDIFELIRADHTQIRNHLNELIDQTSISIPAEKHDFEKPQDWEEAFHDLKVSFVAHARAEEDVLYPLLGEKFAGGRTHEHRLAEGLLAELELLNPRDYSWGEKLGFLRNLIESHQAEEEGTTFDRIRSLIDDDPQQKDELGARFENIRDRIAQQRRLPKRKSALNPAGLNLDG